MVKQSAVNRKTAGSTPAGTAKRNAMTFKETLKLLRELEWSGTAVLSRGTVVVCPSCRREQGHLHHYKCRLKAAIDYYQACDNMAKRGINLWST